MQTQSVSFDRAAGFYDDSRGLPDDLFPPTVAELRAWALNAFGSLDHEFEVTNTFIWERYSH